MSKKLKIGDKVSWNSEAGHVSGRITGIHTKPFILKGKDGTKYLHHASKEEPQYTIKSLISDHVAHHKANALHRMEFGGNPEFNTQQPMKRKVRITKLPKAQNGKSFNDFDCPPGSDCAKNNLLGIRIPNIFAGDPLRREMREENLQLKKFNADPNLWLNTRANFYKNNMDFGKYPVTSWDPQPLKDGTIYYGPQNFPLTGNNKLISSPNLFARFGGNTGDQRGYALHVNYDVPSESNEDQSLRDFIPASPRNESNIEAEQGESLLADLDNDGELEHMKIGGKRHSEGGTPLSVPSGSFIFSDTSKMKIGGEILQHFGKPKNTKKKYTPAELAKQYDLNFYKDKLKEFEKGGSTDKFAKNTAELMLDNNQKKLGLLAFVQESMKGEPIPQVTEELLNDSQEQMRFGGIPKAALGIPRPPDETGKWMGDLFESTNPLTGVRSNNWNAMTNFSSAQDYADAVGYPGNPTGKKGIKAMQSWVAARYPKLVDKYNQVYGVPRNGTIDGNLGVRWDAIGQEIRNKPQPVGSMVPALNTTSRISVSGVPSRSNPVTENPGVATKDKLEAGDANFTEGKPISVTPNAWDVMGVLNAATRPIDHIRPQLFRVNADVTSPSLYDNTAEVQQLQSIAKTNNDTINSTADGQIARANISSNIGRLFDPINQSNMRTNQANVGTMNQFNQYRDQVINQNNSTNTGLLDKFINEDNIFKANLNKEKQMKKADTILQGQNLTNNMITLGSILERTPNYNVKGPFWNPSVFVPGSGDLLKGNNQPTQDQETAIQAKIDDLVKNKNFTPTEAINYLRLIMGQTRTTERDSDFNGYPNSRNVTTVRRG